MEYAAAASQPSAAPPAPAADPRHTHYLHPYAGYPYPYDAYYQPAPATNHSATAAVATSSSYYYPVAATAPTSSAAAAASYDPYSAYQYYPPPAGAAGASADGTGFAGYYLTSGEASHQALALATHHGAAAATGKDAGKHLGFDPQRYAQAAAARASNGMAQVSTPAMHHAQWNAHFGHPLPRNVLRKYPKKKPKVAQQPAPCEVCKIQCDTLEVLLIHKQGKKHKKNLERLQDSITPKPIKPPQNAIGTTMAPPVVADGTVTVVPQKKKKCSSAAATLEELEVKKRRVLEAGAAQGEVKICSVCNIVVNSQKVYEFHIAGQKHQAMVQKKQAVQFVA